MLQETFGGALFRDPSIGFTQFSDAQKTLAAEIGGGIIGLFSLFNIGGRFFWATLSDSIGRKTTYFAFFVLGVFCYASAPALAGMKAVVVFVAPFCIIASMYGGGFATVPAYLSDIFGTRYVGAIHGRLLTAWSTAGIVGPVVNYLHDTRVAQGVPRDHVYDLIFYVLACLLVAGCICNALIRPVHAKWRMKEKGKKSPRRALWLLGRRTPMESAGAVSTPSRSSPGHWSEFRSPGACGRLSKTPRKSFNKRPKQATEAALALASCPRQRWHRWTRPVASQAMPGPFCLREFLVRAEAGSRGCGRRPSFALRKESVQRDRGGL
jgi:MFS family permease